MTILILRNLILFHVLFNCGDKVITAEDRPRFKSVLKSDMFIDKTLLLKEIINGRLISITAPRKFGKSVNLDMIKTFLEIPVDVNGNLVPVEKSCNYKLFQENNLNIFKDRQFFKEHFGLYPIIYIDYSFLLDIQNLEDFTRKFTKVISETFSSYEYLLRNKTLWTDSSEITLFENFITDDVKKDQIPSSFKWLTKLLHRHFGRRVFVLIDESDAVIESLIFIENNDLFDITKIVRETECSLLQSEDVEGAVLVGVLRVFRGTCDNNISHHPFLTSPEFGIHFGITQEELDDLTKKIIKDDKKLTETTNKIINFYSGYSHYPGGRKTIYNTWPILNFLETGTHASDYLCKSNYLYTFKKLCRVHGLTEWLQNLILEKEVKNTHVEVYKPLFRRRHILMLNFALRYNIVDPGKNTTKVFLTFLYHLGYLSPQDGKLRTFQIPSEELRKELRIYTPDRPIDPLADI